MTLYAHVVDNEVVQTGALPQTGELTDGSFVSGFDKLPDAMLADVGWFPLVDNPPTIDETTQYSVLDGYNIFADRVETKYAVKELGPVSPPEPTIDEKLASLQSTVDQLVLDQLMGGAPA